MSVATEDIQAFLAERRTRDEADFLLGCVAFGEGDARPGARQVAQHEEAGRVET